MGVDYDACKSESVHISDLPACLRPFRATPSSFASAPIEVDFYLYIFLYIIFFSIFVAYVLRYINIIHTLSRIKVMLKIKFVPLFILHQPLAKC